MTMIQVQEVMPMLLVACPSFSERWQEHVEEYGNDVFYVASGSFAHHIVACYEDGVLSSFAQTAEVIENLCVNGSPQSRELVIVGLLEGIQNVWGNKYDEPNFFEKYLQPESLRCWRELNRFWNP
jgi:hypothetical protein